MCCFKYSAISATLISALWLTGCASAATKAQTVELKRATMQRWTACLERHTNVDEHPAMQVNNILGKHCEGHKRDVLALYPRNMASQVDELLATNAYRVIDSIIQSKDGATQTGERVHTALR